MVAILRQPDAAVEQIAAVLEGYERSNPGAETAVYRYNPASIRIRIVDAAFDGRSKGERHDHVWRYLRQLPEDVASQVSVVLCLVPGETSLLDIEFRDPTRSYI